MWGLYMRKDLTIAFPDLYMCWKMFENRRDSRVFGFVRTFTDSIRMRRLPA